jgi:NDP-hexose-3-ketoreductase
MTKVLRVGVLGCADIAQRRMLPSMLRQPLVELVAVASRSAAKAASFAERFGCAAVTGYERLLDRSDIDAVYLPLPHHLHAEWTIRALTAGKHVLCEKPFAVTLDEAAEAVAVARAQQLLLMESFMFLHHSQHAAVLRMLHDGVIGELRGFTSEFGIPVTPAGAPASTLPEVAAYPIRAARLFLGDSLEVLGADFRTARLSGLATAGSALLRSDMGVTAHLTYGIEHSYRSEYALWGSEGHILLRRAFSTPDTHTPVVRIERQNIVEERTLAPDNQFVNIAGIFARTILDGGDFGPAADSILQQAELVHTIAQCRRAGREVPRK